MFLVNVTTEFSAAHALRGYDGDCARVHGHNWKVGVELAVNKLDDIGISIDFCIIKDKTKAIISKLDHQLINEIKPFDTINPTAENLAYYFFNNLTKSINDNNARVSKITICETDRSCVSYQPTLKNNNEV